METLFGGDLNRVGVNNYLARGGGGSNNAMDVQQDGLQN